MSNRPCISIRGETYNKVKAHCAGGDSINGVIDDWVTERLDSLGVPVPLESEISPRPRRSTSKRYRREPIGGVHQF